MFLLFYLLTIYTQRSIKGSPWRASPAKATTSKLTSLTSNIQASQASEIFNAASCHDILPSSGEAASQISIAPALCVTSSSVALTKAASSTPGHNGQSACHQTLLPFAPPKLSPLELDYTPAPSPASPKASCISSTPETTTSATGKLLISWLIMNLTVFAGSRRATGWADAL